MNRPGRRQAIALLLSAACGRAVAARTPPARGLVYRMSKGGVRLWLCGSLHRLRKRDHPLPPACESAYQNARRVDFEVPRDALNGRAFRRELARVRQLPDGRELPDVIPAGLWRSAAAAARRWGVPEDSLRRLRPWFAAWKLSEAVWDHHGILTKYGMEEHYYARAEKDGRECGGLDEVASLLDGLRSAADDRRTGERALRDSLRQLDRVPDLYRRMIDVWRDGDEDEIARVFAGGAGSGPDSALHSARNRRWIRRIDRDRRKFAGSLILPGIGHLPGPRGLVAGLTAEGWRAERL